MNIKRMTKAEAYSWNGNGFGGSSKASDYGVFSDNGECLAIIRRTSGGGYMDSTEWTSKSFKPVTMVCCISGKEVVDHRTYSISKTLKGCKEQTLAKLAK